MSSAGITLPTPLLRCSPTTKATYLLVTVVGLLTGFFETPWFSQVPLKTFSSARYGLRPRLAKRSITISHRSVLVSSDRRPSPNGITISGLYNLHAFALWLTDCLYLGFSYFVTLIATRLSSGRMVKPYPGWIHQLISSDLAWHSLSLLLLLLTISTRDS